MPEAKKTSAKKVPATAPEKVEEQAPRGSKTPRGTGKYESTGSYNPKAEKNIKSFEEVCAVLPATLEEITKAIPQHTDFVGYLIRRGAIAES